MSNRVHLAISEVFETYDEKKSGKIDKNQLKKCLFDLNGRNLDDHEVV